MKDKGNEPKSNRKGKKENKDGTLINSDKKSKFSLEGTVLYGEEQDSCDS